ncbi:MAG: Gfo/Idh/MocA family oxidoreductase [Planctomycetaceae bacterium]|nr:Gfo/Idh/MocA family oxidoreductase [Planctomycetaceae bacterium]
MNKEENSKKMNRRSFLETTGTAAVAASALSWTAKSYAGIVGANERIHVGLIGAGVIGNAHMNVYNKLKEPNNLEVTAIVDCWKSRADAGKELTSAKYSLTDYRELLDMKEVDYVTVAVPEHTHSDIVVDAFDAGKAVYCEKPMTHDIEQAQAVWAKQKETGLPLQVGVQGMSDDSYIAARKAIDGGMIGHVVQAQIEYVRHYPDHAGPWRVPESVEKYPTKPADLNWNAWLGHAPKIDWDPHHYFEWRNYRRYSGGICTDLFIHRISRIMKACNLLYPRRVVGMGGIWQWDDGRDLPDNFEMICEYPRGMTVYVLGTMSNRRKIDHIIRGTDGYIEFTSDGWVAKDDKNEKEIASHKKTGAEDMHLHETNLHNHLRNGEELNCPVELGMAGVVAVNMANESWRSGRMMAWDKENEKMVSADSIELSHRPEEV